MAGMPGRCCGPRLAARCPNIPGAGIRLAAASLAVRCGRPGEGRQHLDRALELVAENFPGTRWELAAAGAEVLIAEGKPQEAVDWVRARLTQPGIPPIVQDDDLLVHYANAAAELAQAARDASDPAGAARAVAGLDDVLDARPWEPFTRGDDSAARSMRCALFHAEVARCRDDSEQVDRWDRAIDACEAAGAPWHGAVSRWRYAEAAIAAGQPPVEVGEILRQARRSADELGAEPLPWTTTIAVYFHRPGGRGSGTSGIPTQIRLPSPSDRRAVAPAWRW